MADSQKHCRGNNDVKEFLILCELCQTQQTMLKWESGPQQLPRSPGYKPAKEVCILYSKVKTYHRDILLENLPSRVYKGNDSFNRLQGW